MYRQRIAMGLVVLSLGISFSVYFYNEGQYVLLTSNKHHVSKLCGTCYPVQRNDSDHVELNPDMEYVPVEDISRDLFRDRYEDITVTLKNINYLDTIKLDQTSLRERLMTSAIDFEGFQYIPGGHWKPTNATTDKSKVALLVPFRNRERTIGIFLRHMVPFILRQQLEFGIFVVEQVDSLKFNRGMLMNVGYLEALRFDDWDCIVIHDVDFIPRYDDTSYTCHNMPRHFLSGLAKRPKVFDFEFNGVTGFTVQQYREMNGAPNRYWGWGGEDHDLRTRAELMKYKIYRTKYPYGFYDHIPHVKHKNNETEENWPTYNKEVKDYQFRDGLNNIKYAQPKVTILPLYVHISVALSHLEILPIKSRKER